MHSLKQIRARDRKAVHKGVITGTNIRIRHRVTLDEVARGLHQYYCALVIWRHDFHGSSRTWSPLLLTLSWWTASPVALDEDGRKRRMEKGTGERSDRGQERWIEKTIVRRV